MRFYQEKILPHLISKVCASEDLMALRQSLIPRAKGAVLEVGMGSGINLSLYQPSEVTRVYGLEPSAGMRHKAIDNANRSPVPLEWLNLPGEEIPLADASIDTVVLTFTLCSIAGWAKALSQMKRVLRADGKLLFLEHGESPDAKVQRWQHRITPAWKRIGGGCHLNRPIADLIRSADLDIVELDTFYLKGAPRIAGYIYRGVAVHSKADILN